VGDDIEGSETVSITKALDLAKGLGLDLVEIAPKAMPPVCRIVDYKKFLYHRKKKEKENKAKSVKIVVKEIRLGPNTDEHDFNFKLRHAQKFLSQKAKVKVIIMFKGRSIVFKEQGEELLHKLAKELEGESNVEQMPKLEGKRMSMILVSNKK